MAEFQWSFVDVNGAQQGPGPASALRDALARGALRMDSMVWREGLGQWVSLQQVAAEVGLGNAPPPPPNMVPQVGTAGGGMNAFIPLAVAAGVALICGVMTGPAGFMKSFVTSSMAWVYWDATQNKIGKINGATGFFNMPAGGWAALAWLLWIVGFPAYLAKRNDLIERAKANPVTPASRSMVLGFLIVIAVFGTLAGMVHTAAESS
ncbi:MAG: DUF4339 domain-containing protein [Proteobacteria bacterium]|nr:DUF4339 domain-containing protein [Pseudomonadota bacterium]